MNTEEREEIEDELTKAAGKLAANIADGSLPRALIPDAGICLIYGAEHARSLADIAAVTVMPDGKISEDAMFDAAGGRNGDKGDRGTGAGLNRSITLTAMRFDPDIRSAAILRYSKPVVDKAREMLFEVREADRRNAGSSTPLMDWRTAFCCKKEDVPDIIFIAGEETEEPKDAKAAKYAEKCDNSAKTGADCEPMIILLGISPSATVNNILMLGERINNRN